MRARVLATSLGATAAVLLLLGIPVARADSCADEAAQDLQECKAVCAENFQVTKDACVNKDHDCMEECRVRRGGCREASGLDDALDACRATLRGAKESCRTQYGDPGEEDQLDTCIDQAQVVAFQCRDTAREAARSALRQCRREFRHCARACPEGAGPVTDPRQCRRDALAAKYACKADCKEAFQVQKDACLGRDHACVEDCRADREVCRKPIEEQLEADIAACNATKTGAIQNCENLYGEGTPERDQCIDNAQVAAFQCKDPKREAARPQFQVCRDQFRTCVQACPPATP